MSSELSGGLDKPKITYVDRQDGTPVLYNGLGYCLHLLVLLITMCQILFYGFKYFYRNFILKNDMASCTVEIWSLCNTNVAVEVLLSSCELTT